MYIHYHAASTERSEMHIVCCGKNLNKLRPLISSSLMWGILLKRTVKKFDGRAWIGLIKHMMGIIFRLF
jgi:hypothetical protein